MWAEWIIDTGDVICVMDIMFLEFVYKCDDRTRWEHTLCVRVSRINYVIMIYAEEGYLCFTEFSWRDGRKVANPAYSAIINRKIVFKRHGIQKQSPSHTEIPETFENSREKTCLTILHNPL